MDVLRTPLSPNQVLQYLSHLNRSTNKQPKYTKVVEYQDIIDAHSLHNFFDGTDSIIIFYPAFRHKKGFVYGHYTALVKHSLHKAFYLYDSLAYKVDEYKRFADPNLYIEKVNSLVKHFIIEKYNGWTIDYNHRQHQSRKPEIATCGRWSALRCYRSDLSNDEFHKFVTKLYKKAVGKNDRLKDKLFLYI